MFVVLLLYLTSVLFYFLFYNIPHYLIKFICLY
nr:MAG TPA: hypothetical protein [Caudoviricetes sp.]